MASKADILASLRAEISSIENGCPSDFPPFPKGERKGEGRGLAKAPRRASEVPSQAKRLHCEEPCPAFVKQEEARVASCFTNAPKEQQTVARSEAEDDAAQAYAKVLRLCGVRERSSEELRKRLAREEFSARAVDAALAKAQRLRVVDDARFARSFIRSKLAAGKGRRGIERDLASRGVALPPDEVWEDAQSGGAGELDRALGVLRKSPPRSKNQREGAFRKLVGRGYATDIAATAARLWVENG